MPDEATGPDEGEVVEAAAAAARSVVFSRLDSGEVADLDVTVTFEDRVLDVDVYLHAPDTHRDVEQIADDAALAARTAADDLLEGDGNR